MVKISLPTSAARQWDSTDAVPAPAAEEDEWDREWQQHVLAAATERIARQVNPLHFQVFDLYVLQQWPLLRVTKDARQPGVGLCHRPSPHQAAEGRDREITKAARMMTA